MMKRTAILAAAVLALVAAAPHYSVQHRTVSTKSRASQAAFDEGLTLLYSFNRDASRRSFDRALATDPHLAMASWGVAATYAGNINFASDRTKYLAGRAALQTAVSHLAYANAPERALIRALQVRYDRGSSAYAAAMKAVYAAYPEDADVATFYAQSLMELRPWALYSVSGRPEPGTPEIVDMLERTLRAHPLHIGANHLCIHALEAASDPSPARACADRIAAMRFEPAAEHLTHMPSHAYARVGAFAAAARSNEEAVASGYVYLHEHPDDVESALYQVHNFMFLQYADAAMERYAPTLRSAEELAALGFQTPLMFTYVRFARWNEALAMQRPAQSRNEPTRVLTWHFARGMAYAGLGDVKRAAVELRALALDPASAMLPDAPGTYQAPRVILQMARLVLGAHIAAASGRATSAIATLRRAVALQDSFIYAEPPDWYAPAREDLGAMLLASGRAAEAADAFRRDLQLNPGNPRSARGLQNAQRRSR